MSISRTKIATVDCHKWIMIRAWMNYDKCSLIMRQCNETDLFSFSALPSGHWNRPLFIQCTAVRALKPTSFHSVHCRQDIETDLFSFSALPSGHRNRTLFIQCNRPLFWYSATAVNSLNFATMHCALSIIMNCHCYGSECILFGFCSRLELDP